VLVSVLTRVRGSVRAGIEAVMRASREVLTGGTTKIIGWRAEISRCYNGRGNTGVDKRVLSIRNCEVHEWIERPAADNLLNSPTCMNRCCALCAHTFFWERRRPILTQEKPWTNVYLRLAKLILTPESPNNFHH